MVELAFGCTEARSARYAATPTLSLTLHITESTGIRVHAIALRCQIRIEPHRRRYSADEARRLNDLFGDPSRWAETVKPIQLATVSAMVPGFTSLTEIELPVPCTYDLEVASARYLQGLDDGTIPLLLLFSGTVFIANGDSFSVELIPWSCEASYRMPVAVWQDVVNDHFPGSAWLRCGRETLDALSAFKASRALPTWDATLSALLAAAGPPGRRPPGRRSSGGRSSGGRSSGGRSSGGRSSGDGPRRHRFGPGRDDLAGGTAVSLDAVRRIADAVLYEGYILYPYRASAQKNRSRWQFGVLMPPGYAVADPSESPMMRAECVFEHHGQPTVEVTVRFLQVQRRRTGGTAGDMPAPDTSVQDATGADESVPAVWDEAVEREVTVTVSGEALLGDGAESRFTVPGGTDLETMAGARVARRREPLSGSVSVRATPLPGPWQAARLTVRVTNESAGTYGGASPAGEAAASREEALPAALVAAHLVITVSGGSFLSMTDPPEWASAQVAACQNKGCWPVLADPEGGRQVMLAAPIILPDHPQVAAESPGELYDGTEIDEILTLRTLALSDEEKAAARATDPRAAALIDRVDAMDAPTMAQLHGTIRAMTAHRPAGEPASPASPDGDGEHVPWWDPGADASVSPGTDYVIVAGHRVARGSRVILRPGSRRADAQDMFLAGRAALVEAVLLDVDDTAYLAVTLADDPAADLQSAHGRFLYFSPDEVEPGATAPDADETGGASDASLGGASQ